MPGLLRGVARTAVVAGTATAVSNRVSRRQANRWAAQGEAQPGYLAPEQPPQQQQMAMPPQQDDIIDQLRDLAALRDQGVLTDAEFASQKTKLLAEH
jgi:hypothetical protein